VRVRQALLHLIDRDTLAASFSPRATRADLFLAKEDPVYRLAEQRGFATYPYDATQAARLFSEAGWSRSAGGAFQSATGQRFSIEVRSVETTPLNTRQALAVMDQWKQGGVDSELTNIPNNVANRSELKAATVGIYMGNETVTADVLQAFTSSQMATPQNNWAGRNFTAYVNPDYDALYARFLSELDLTRRQSVQVDLLSWAGREQFVLPLFYTAATGITSFRRGIRGPGPVLPVLKVGTWNIHEWEMD
jgi:peptide/nickel transport system substrate-binding protein